jgi:hypothetical protein
MTTKHSPPHLLKAQANMIAATIRAAERGEKVDARFAAKLEAARIRETFSVGVLMDDKVVVLKLSWEKIRTTDEAALAEYIFKLMQETKDAA